MNAKKSIGSAGVALVFVSVLLTGCSGSAGGDTTCKTFNGQSSSDQTSTIKSYLKDKGKDPSNMEVAATKLSAKAFCKTAGKDSSKISDIEHG